VIKDREAAKREVFERIKAEKGRATPAQVEEKLFDLERQAGILEALRGVEQAGGCREQRAGAVDIDGTAFQNDARTENREVEQLGDALRDGVIIVMKAILVAIRIVAPVDDGELVTPREENRTMIAAPRFVGRNMMIEDVRCAFADGASGDGCDLVVADIDMDGFVRGEGADHFAERGEDLLVAVRKTGAVRTRPAEPRGRVRMPLGGHAVAEFPWSFCRH